MKHVMIDLETLGTAADAVVMSIGAVKFDLESSQIADAGFYASISIESNLDKGRRIDEDTLIWWFKQNQAAQKVFFEPKQSLGDALESLSEWFASKELFVWSNGADFDLPMLAHAYRSFDWAPPWGFWNSRCFRTYKNLPGANKIPRTAPGIAHNALSDAISQAVTLQAIHAGLLKTKAA